MDSVIRLLRLPLHCFRHLLCIVVLHISSQAQAQPYYTHPFVMGIGMHSGRGMAPPAKALPILEYAGANSVRQEATWSRIELEKDKLKYPPNLQDVETYVNHFDQKGGQPLLLLTYGNKFYDDGDIPHSDEAIAGFARYAGFMAQHFKGRVKFYEVWNEWDIGLGSNKKPRTVGSVQTYVKLLKAAHAAIKAADPNATVLGGVSSTTHPKWDDEFMKLGGLDYLDGFSTHPYLMWNVKSKPENSVELLDGLHDRIEKAAPSRKIPLYVTEIGWPNHRGTISWTPQQTADFVMRFHLLAKSRPFVGGVWWYTLSNTGRDENDKEQNFGLVEVDYAHKPALEAYRMTSRLLLASPDVSVQSVKHDQLIEAKITIPPAACSALWMQADSYDEAPELAQNKLKQHHIWGKGRRWSETPHVSCDSEIKPRQGPITDRPNCAAYCSLIKRSE